MLGYRDAEREWLGKFPARLDDAVHFVPARLTALCLLLAGSLRYGRLASAVLVWRRDRWLTASPNAGQPMSAAAGVLSVELEKVDCYRLGAGQRPPVAGDIPRAIALVADACALFVVAATVCFLVFG
jgi:adenosylcobinamide-phosphate synthase